MSAAEMLTVKVIAKAIGKTERRVHDLATEGEWGFRLKKVKGGRAKVFDIDTLPDDVQAALARHQARQLAPPEPARTPAEALEVAELADWQRTCADARAAILRHLYTLSDVYGLNKAVRTVEAAARDGALPAPVAALVPRANARAGADGGRTLSERTLKRWHSVYRKDGWRGLVPQDAARAKDAPEWAPMLLKLYQRPTKPSLMKVVTEDLPRALPAGMTVPSYAQANRFLKSLSPAERERGRRSANELLALQGFKRRSTEGLEPLMVATSDGHTLKGLVAHPIHGRPFAPEVCTMMDVVTRYVFGWSAGLAESRWVVMDAIRHGVSSLGMFALLFTDNGSGFVNETMDDEEVQGLMARCGATHTTSIPGRAQSRGKIERLQGSLWKRSARDLVTYRGRDMDQEARKKVDKILKRDMRETGGSRYLMTWGEFLQWAQSVVDGYNNRPHRSLPKVRDAETEKLRHMTPAEALAAWRAKGWEPERLPAPVVEDLFRPYEMRSVNRGEVSLPWGKYYDDRLVHWHGQKVRVGYDIHDGMRVWVRERDSGRLICVAKRDGNVVPEQPANMVEHALRKRAGRRLALIDQHRLEAEAELGPALLEADVADGGLPLITSIPRSAGTSALQVEPDGDLLIEAEDGDEELWERLGQVGAAFMAERKHQV
jgi:putative transposase